MYFPVIAATWNFFKPDDSQPGVCLFDKSMDFCMSPSLLSSSQCNLGSIEDGNQKSYYLLERLLHEPFFRYFKVNLKKPCPFWDEAMSCFSDQCAIDVLSDEPTIPKPSTVLVGEGDSLNDVKFPKFQQNLKLFEKFEMDDADFCKVDNDDCDGVYVDLIENTERFTDYSGPSSHRIWSSIYDDTCFIKDWKDEDDKKLFFRIVSGLHSSISVHLSDRYYNRAFGRWESVFSMFHERVGKYPERVRNMYLTYTLLMRAVTKIRSHMKNVQLGVQPEEEIRARKLITSLFKALPKYPATFDKNLFGVTPSQADNIKSAFRNMAKLMDCVSCERCRLWGKVQIYGIGTALKILTAKNLSETKFTRGEIVTLFNAFGRLSESVMSTRNFREFYDPESPQISQSLQKFHDFRILMGLLASIVFLSTIYIINNFKRSPSTPANK